MKQQQANSELPTSLRLLAGALQEAARTGVCRRARKEKKTAWKKGDALRRGLRERVGLEGLGAGPARCQARQACGRAGTRTAAGTSTCGCLAGHTVTPGQRTASREAQEPAGAALHSRESVIVRKHDLRGSRGEKQAGQAAVSGGRAVCGCGQTSGSGGGGMSSSVSKRCCGARDGGTPYGVKLPWGRAAGEVQFHKAVCGNAQLASAADRRPSQAH